MCGCFVLLLGSFAPRLALVLMALFTNDISRAFNGSWVLPLIGWFLIPFTTLVYVLISVYHGSVSGFWWFFVVLAFLGDIGAYGGGYNRRDDIYHGNSGASAY